MQNPLKIQPTSRLFLKPTRLNPLKEGILYCTFVALLLKSLFLMGFITSSNHRAINFSRAVNSVYSPVLYCFFITLLLSFAFLFKGKGRAWYLLSINSFVSILFLSDLWYFRSFGTFISPHLLKQTANLDNLSGSIFSMMHPYDFVFCVDLFVLLFLSIRNRTRNNKHPRSLAAFLLLFILSLAMVLYIPFTVHILGKEHPKQHLFEVSWVPTLTMKHLSPVGYHLFDSYIYWKDSRKLTLDAEQKEKIQTWFQEKQEPLPDNQYKGLLKGKNLLFIQVESLENFIINKNVDGQELTPTINKLLEHSLYFSNVHDQVNEGNSSDSDFMVNTSVYPVRRGSTFFRYPNNTYKSLPRLLEGQGYSTLAIHPDKGSYWNWMQNLQSIGFDQCIDDSSFVHDEIIGLGLSDKSFLRQVRPLITKQKQPFYIFMVTLTSHTPFELPEKDQALALPENLKGTKLGGYFQCIQYTDKHIGLLLSELENQGILDNTVVAIAGDHTGIHKYYPNSLDHIKNPHSWWLYNYRQIPFLVFHKAIKGETIRIKGGQIDIFPTLAYLMDVEEDNYLYTAMGRNLLKTQKDFYVAPNGVYFGEERNEEEKQHAIEGLNIADLIIRSNYFSNQ